MASNNSGNARGLASRAPGSALQVFHVDVRNRGHGYATTSFVGRQAGAEVPLQTGELVEILTTGVQDHSQPNIAHALAISDGGGEHQLPMTDRSIREPPRPAVARQGGGLEDKPFL